MDDKNSAVALRSTSTSTTAIDIGSSVTVSSEVVRVRAGQVLMTRDQAVALAGASLTVRDVIREALAGSKRQAEYSAFYNAFLLNQLSEQEFEALSEGFAVTEQYSDDDLAERIQILIDEIGEKFLPEQLAFMFSSPLLQIDRVLERLDAVS